MSKAKIDRRVAVIRDGREIELRFSEIRDKPFVVLLGEPGSGKSSALEYEAEVEGGKEVTCREVANGLVDLRGKNTAYLDALDEYRSSGDRKDKMLQIAKALRDSGVPRWRLTCRAEDWSKPAEQVVKDIRRATRRMVLVVLPALAIGGLLFPLLAHAQPSLLGVHAHENSRYKLTVSFEVDGAVITESTIIDYELRVSSGLGTGSNIASSLRRGEAMIVPIPEAGNVYVLPIHLPYHESVRQGYSPSLIAEACDFMPVRAMTTKDQVDWVRSVANFEGRCRVPEPSIPLMVRFVDPENFMTMEWLSTEEVATLSDGRARFLEAWVETTRQPPTFRHTPHLRHLFAGHERPVVRVPDPYSGSVRRFFPGNFSTEMR